ncbi:MAG: hypothetical protein APF84_09425 [Gracilibacter sp. BRH_c7a]|nr:MAG: hypothetical protein APF84_09425 [Gracilibacter sp. BRH_c7a]
MIVFLLDVGSECRNAMVQCLREDIKIKSVNVFEDYIAFIEQVGKILPDLCFIRLGVDKIPGLTAARMVKQIGVDSRIVFLSEDEYDALEAYEIGAYGYLLYPVVKEKLENILAKVG